MNVKKIVITGGTGFIGQELQSRFLRNGYKLIIVSRKAGDVQWSDTQGLIDSFNGADFVLNLAGKSVDCRFTEKNKAALLSTRIETTRRIGEIIELCSTPPLLWINASGASIYSETSIGANTEAAPVSGRSFMAEVARQWEAAMYSFKLPKTRQVALRISLVLGKSGGVLPIFRKLAKFLLAGATGSGKQKVSWVHIEDFYRILIHIMNTATIEGPVNCAAPNVVDNKEFMRAIRNSVGMPFGFPAPAFAIQLASPLIDVEPSLLLNSMWVEPAILLKTGFKFSYPEINSALGNLR